MTTLVTLICHYCGKQFTRTPSGHKWNIRENRHVFCSLSCSAIWGNRAGLTNPNGNPENLVADNRKDEYSAFRYFRNAIRRRKHEHNIDLPYLKILWEEQDGKCPLTGWKLRLPYGTKGFKSTQPDNASLDRIDGGIGYVEGNVRYIALIANFARNTWDDEALMTFAYSVVRYDELYG